jgi:hypothetical protein
MVTLSIVLGSGRRGTMCDDDVPSPVLTPFQLTGPVVSSRSSMAVVGSST